MAGATLDALPYWTTFEIVRALPHDGDSFTQGLAFARNGTMFESAGLYGKSAVRVLETDRGLMVRETPNEPTIFGEGITVIRDEVVAQLSWRENKINEYNATDLSLLRTVAQPPEMREGWGITGDGAGSSVLYASDGSDKLFHLAADGSYEVRRSLQATDLTLGSAGVFAGYEGGGALNGLNELEMVRVGPTSDWEVWANLYPMNEHRLSECIVRLNPSTGRALGWIDMRGLLAAQRSFVRQGSSTARVDTVGQPAACTCPGVAFANPPARPPFHGLGPRRLAGHYVLNGIAFDAPTGRIFVTGKQWDHLYEVKIKPHPRPQANVGCPAQLRHT